MFRRKKVFCIVDGNETCSLLRRGYQLERSDYREHVLNLEVGQGVACGPKGERGTNTKFRGLERAAARVKMTGMQRTVDDVVYFIRRT